jgi:hypothetical protein
LTIEGDPIRPSCTNVDAQARAPQREYLDAASNRRPANVTDLPYVSSRIVAGGDDPTCGGRDSATGRRLELRPPHFGSSCASQGSIAALRSAQLGRTGDGRHCPARAAIHHRLFGSGPRDPRAPSGEIPQADTGCGNRKPHRQPPYGWALQFRAIREAQDRLQVNDAGTLHRPKCAEGNQHHCRQPLQTIEHFSARLGTHAGAKWRPAHFITITLQEYYPPDSGRLRQSGLGADVPRSSLRVATRRLLMEANWLVLQLRGQAADYAHSTTTIREPWNKGKPVDQKGPFKLKETSAITVGMQFANRRRELALSDLVFDSSLRACDLVKLRVHDACHGSGMAPRDGAPAEDSASRPVQDHGADSPADRSPDQGHRADGRGPAAFEPGSRAAPSVDSPVRPNRGVVGWTARLDRVSYGSCTLRRTKSTLIYRRMQSPRAAGLLSDALPNWRSWRKLPSDWTQFLGFAPTSRLRSATNGRWCRRAGGSDLSRASASFPPDAAVAFQQFRHLPGKAWTWHGPGFVRRSPAASCGLSRLPIWPVVLQMTLLPGAPRCANDVAAGGVS